MPPASRISDIGSGHGCFPPTSIISGSSNVITCSIPQARLGDSLAPHGCPPTPPHGRSLASGSSTVFVNNLPAARIGDSISCGGSVVSGCSTVIIGG